MAGNDGAGDLFMKFVLVGHETLGDAISAESTADLSSADDTANLLLAGFGPKRFFEVTNFTFGAGVIDDDNTPPVAGGNGQTISPHGLGSAGNRAGDRQHPDRGQSIRPRQLSFQRWRNSDIESY